VERSRDAKDFKDKDGGVVHAKDMAKDGIAVAPAPDPNPNPNPNPEPLKEADRVAAQQGNAGKQPSNKQPGTEVYNHYVDNPYFAVALDPRSTFGTSVDTASYSNIRRFLTTDGQLPPKDAVRIADMLNYFPYTYPRPQGEAPVAFAMNMTTCPWNGDRYLLRVALAARTHRPEEMPPRNFVFLIDTSGSMNPQDRLPLFVKGLKMLVAQLRPQDHIAIVVYASATGVLLPCTPGNEKAKINAALDTLHANGSTDGYSGIQEAYKIARANYIKGGVNRVILGTDGDFNVGVTNPADLIRMIDEQRKSGIYLTVLGFGYGNIKDNTLERLAHHGAGHFSYVDSLAEARKVFVEQGGGLMTVAKDVKLQLEFNPRRVAGYRLIGYENKLLRTQDFNNDDIAAGNMGSGHTVTALYEIVPAGMKVPGVEVDPLKYQIPATPGEAANTGEFLTVKLRYKDPEAETSKLLEQPLAGMVEKFDEATEDMRFAAAVAEFGLLLRDSPYKASASYEDVLGIARKALGKDENAHRTEFVTLVTRARDLSRR
jgi:Ca-activated chloride channel family protein